jgi:hypothetical protein
MKQKFYLKKKYLGNKRGKIIPISRAIHFTGYKIKNSSSRHFSCTWYRLVNAMSKIHPCVIY